RAEGDLTLGGLKRRNDLLYYVPEGEAEIIVRLTSHRPGPLPVETIRAVWRELLSGCRALEQPLAVGYLGPRGSFTHQAALKQFGEASQFVPTRAIVDVFDE